jgi:hypothetical protein
VVAIGGSDEPTRGLEIIVELVPLPVADVTPGSCSSQQEVQIVDHDPGKWFSG